MALALLFPGQGAQHPLMLPWLDGEPAAQPWLRVMEAQVGAGWRERLGDAEWATTNGIAQPLLVGVELAAWACLAPLLPAPAIVAGYSVGELAACGAAGALDTAEAVRLASVRAEAMDRSVAGRDTALLAVRDMPLARIQQWCEHHGLALAIRLGADRAIVGGERVALQRATEDARMRSASFTPLGVRIASHTPWMAAASAAFAPFLCMRAPRCPIACNLTGAALRHAQPLQHALAQQISHPVLWDSCLETVRERGATCVLEVGPGTTLATMWRSRHPCVPCRSVDEFRSVGAVVEWVAKVMT